MIRDTDQMPEDEATAPHRRNSQGKHEGVPHSPEEFDVMNPAKQKPPATDKPTPA